MCSIKIYIILEHSDIFPTRIFYPKYLKYSRIHRLIDLLILCNTHSIYDGLRRTPGLRRKLVVSVKNPTRILIPHWEEWSRHVVTDSDPLVASSLRVFCAWNSQNTRKELATRGWESVTICRDHSSQWGMRIRVGFFTETTSFLRNPRVRRNSSYVTAVMDISAEIRKI